MLTTQADTTLTNTVEQHLKFLAEYHTESTSRLRSALKHIARNLATNMLDC
jgi:hypothetical protein